jgi:RNA polymerase sigma-70 factor (ECF subfamily)
MTAQSNQRDDVKLSTPAAETLPDFTGMVCRIQEGCEEAADELYRQFNCGIRYFLSRELGPDRAEDLAQDVFAALLEAIRKGEIREPERLAGFVRTIVRRTIASEFGNLRKQRDRNHELDEWQHPVGPKIESDLIHEEHLALAERVLRSLRPRDREVLVRFYCQEQPADKICLEMGLTPTQFRLMKNRAKDKLAQKGDLVLSSRRKEAGK